MKRALKRFHIKMEDRQYHNNRRVKLKLPKYVVDHDHACTDAVPN